MVEIRFAEPDERDAVIAYLHRSFPRAKWDLQGWQRLLSGRWAAPEDPFAVTVWDGPSLVGALGLVMSRRQTDAGPARVCNLSSWYVDKPYRGQGIGQRVMQLVTEDPELTCTNLSSARGALGVVANVGLKVLDSERCFWRAGAGDLLPCDEDPLQGGHGLAARDLQVLRDHAGLNLRAAVVSTPDGPYLAVLSVKQKVDDHISHELLYHNAPDLLARHAPQIARSLLHGQGRAMFYADARFVPEGTEVQGRAAIPVPRFYSPGALPKAQVDLLYSEIVLLDMKLY